MHRVVSYNSWYSQDFEKIIHVNFEFLQSVVHSPVMPRKPPKTRFFISRKLSKIQNSTVFNSSSNNFLNNFLVQRWQLNPGNDWNFLVGPWESKFILTFALFCLLGIGWLLLHRQIRRYVVLVHTLSDQILSYCYHEHDHDSGFLSLMETHFHYFWSPALSALHVAFNIRWNDITSTTVLLFSVWLQEMCLV